METHLSGLICTPEYLCYLLLFPNVILLSQFFVNGCYHNPILEKHRWHIPHGRAWSLMSAAEPGGTCWDKLRVFIRADQNSYLLKASWLRWWIISFNTKKRRIMSQPVSYRFEQPVQAQVCLNSQQVCWSCCQGLSAQVHLRINCWLRLESSDFTAWFRIRAVCLSFTGQSGDFQAYDFSL